MARASYTYRSVIAPMPTGRLHHLKYEGVCCKPHQHPYPRSKPDSSSQASANGQKLKAGGSNDTAASNPGRSDGSQPLRTRPLSVLIQSQCAATDDNKKQSPTINFDEDWLHESERIPDSIQGSSIIQMFQTMLQEATPVSDLSRIGIFEEEDDEDDTSSHHSHDELSEITAFVARDVNLFGRPR
ncbi:hypothetical protein SeMB42_g03611 [Synchytrium endobioticum]|nr:hypothetical protein SeMB42_g03611 [Synchytrium endobioticum]